MSVEEFLALPDDGVHRELIRGTVREFRSDDEEPIRGPCMTVRNRIHSRVVIRIGQLLANWMDARPEPRGEVVGGEAGFRLKGTPESLVEIDVAVASAEQAAMTGPEEKTFNGPPILAVEVLSPSDTHQDFVDTVTGYLDVGTVVWIVDPDLRVVTIYQPGCPPRMLTERDEIKDEPYLPGFQASVGRFFR
jgi:Uma2 family endonuclease